MVAAAAALVAAAMELAALAYLRFGEARLLQVVGPKAVWWVPIGLLLLSGLAGALVWLLGGVLSPLRRPSFYVGVVTATAMLSPLLAFHPRLHAAAALLLAVGLGVQAARWVGRDPARALRTGGRIVAGVGMTLVVVATTATVVERRNRLRDGAGEPASRSLPNVLLVVLDTVRAAELSLYGYRYPTTPFLDELALRGVVFDRAIAPASWTLPTHASIFTGQWPSRLEADWKSPLASEHRTLAEHFRAAGYRTGGFVGNLTYTSAETGLAQGFERYVARRSKPTELLHAIAVGRFVYDAPRFRSLFGNPWPVTRNSAPELRALFLDWVDGIPAERPFFGFLNLFDAHRPYHPTPELRGRFGPVTEIPLRSRIRRFLDNRGPTSGQDSSTIAESKLRYDEAIATLDLELRRLVEGLEQRGRLAQTVIIITSDHGELFGEGGRVGHGGDLQINTVHVPLLITGPGIARGVRVARETSLRDLARTLADLTGSGGAEFEGQSLRPLWEGHPEAPTSPAISMISGTISRGRPPGRHAPPIAFGSLAARVVDSFQLVVSTTGETELYRLSDDPPWADAVPLSTLPADSLGNLVGDLWATWGGRSSRVGPLIEAARTAPRDPDDAGRVRVAGWPPWTREAHR